MTLPLTEPQYLQIRDAMNNLSELCREFGIDNIDDLYDIMKEYEDKDPKRICCRCSRHIYDRHYSVCTKCGQSFHDNHFDDHFCVADEND